MQPTKKTDTSVVFNPNVTPLPVADSSGVIGNSLEPIIIPTVRTKEEVYGEFWRSMPPPSMLQNFWTAISRRRSDIRVDCVLGAIGAGKTMTGQTIGKLTSDKAPLTIDCANMNCEELIFKPAIVDNQSNILQEISNRYSNNDNSLDPVSRKLIQDELGDFIEDGKINWEAFNEKANSERILQVLEKVAKPLAFNLGLSKDKNAIGIQMQNGPLTKCYLEGREIILDELNRAKQGTVASLTGLLQLMSGLRSDPIEKTSGERTILFTKPTTDNGFFITILGNTAEFERAGEVKGLPSNIIDRIRPRFIGKPNAADLAHILCIELSGLPLTTLQEFYGGKELDTQELWELRILGMTKAQVEQIPNYQRDLLNHPQQVIQAATQLGQFYNDASLIIHDADENLSKVFGEKTAKELGSIDIEDSRKDLITTGVRAAVGHLLDALSPRKIRYGAINKTQQKKLSLIPNLNDVATINLSELNKANNRNTTTLGTDLSYVITDYIKQSCSGCPGLENVLTKIAEKNGICETGTQDADFKKNPTFKTIIELLDLNRKEEKTSEEAIALQKYLVAEIKANNPSLANSPDDDIISSFRVQACISAIPKKENEKDEGKLIVPDPNFINDKSHKATPIQVINITDINNESYSREQEKEILALTADTTNLTNARHFLATIGQKVTKKLLSDAIKNSAEQKIEEDLLALDSKDARTTESIVVVLEHNKKQTPVVIIYDKLKQQYHLIGDKAINPTIGNTANTTWYPVDIKKLQEKSDEVLLKAYNTTDPKEAPIGCTIESTLIQTRIETPTVFAIQDQQSKKAIQEALEKLKKIRNTQGQSK
jgi:hypothetical protein